MTTWLPLPLARTAGRVPRRPDDRPRRDDRRRRAAVDPRGPRLLGDVARVGRERVPAHVRRLPPARRPVRRPLRAPAAVPRGITLFTLASLACGLASSQAMLVGARAVQGIGGAVVSAVALSLIVTLFTEPAERAKAMGVFGFVASGGGSIGVLLGGVITDVLDWHWIFLVNVPIGIAVVVLSLMLLPAARVATAALKLDIAGAVTVTASLMLAVYAIVNGNEVGLGHGADARAARRRGGAAGRVPRHRVARRVAARAAPPLPAPEHRRLERRRRPLGRRDVRVVLPLARSTCSSCSATARSRSGSRSCPATSSWESSRSASRRCSSCGSGSGSRSRSGSSLAGARASALRSRSGRRDLRRRRAPGDDPARARRRHGVQPGAARRDERRRAGRGRPRVRCGQHRVHDGRRARPGVLASLAASRTDTLLRPEGERRAHGGYHAHSSSARSRRERGATCRRSVRPVPAHAGERVDALLVDDGAARVRPVSPRHRASRRCERPGRALAALSDARVWPDGTIPDGFGAGDPPGSACDALTAPDRRAAWSSTQYLTNSADISASRDVAKLGAPSRRYPSPRPARRSGAEGVLRIRLRLVAIPSRRRRRGVLRRQVGSRDHDDRRTVRSSS